MLRDPIKGHWNKVKNDCSEIQSKIIETQLRMIAWRSIKDPWNPVNNKDSIKDHWNPFKNDCLEIQSKVIESKLRMIAQRSNQRSLKHS